MSYRNDDEGAASSRALCFVRSSFHVSILAVTLAGAALAGAAEVHATSAASVGSDFYYTFNASGTLYEAGSMQDSTSPYFWVNSGGKLLIENGLGKTIQNELEEDDPVRLLYSAMNPLDTENGYTPQNTFRLVTRSRWGDSEQQMKFRITEQNLSDSPNRQGYNGVLLINRYADQDNLYYAGVRNDGLAVIKKKIHGTYYTLAEVQIFGTPGKYDRDTKPSLLPLNKWVGLKTQVYNLSNGAVRIRLLIDRENDSNWISILAVDDNGVGGAPFRNAEYSGIRTDFMDVEFDNYRVRKI